MSIQTNLLGRLRNTPLPVTSGLLPLYEAVVNSIHSIEEAHIDNDRGRIDITILRKPKQSHLDLNDNKKKKGPEALEDILSFEITDNGIGFTDENMSSFHTLDSEHKAIKGCRGVGRLLWLKAFDKVLINSTYIDTSGVLKKRGFSFSAQSGVDTEIVLDAAEGDPRETSIILNGFHPRYRDYARKTPQAIADSILEHCLWYFIREGSAPLIRIWDDGEAISLNDLFDGRMHSDAITESLVIKDHKFELTHVKLRSNSLLSHSIAYCADNRLVNEEKLTGKIPGLHGKISDGDGEFIYSCYVSSHFLNESVRPERTGFEISEANDGLFDLELDFRTIREAVIASSRRQLSEHLTANLHRAKERVDTFVTQKAPRYRPILSRIPESNLNIDPEISDKDLDVTLHKHLAEIERELLTEGHNIMAVGAGENLIEYKKRLNEYLSKAEDIKQSDLANYVSHRRVILDLLDSAIQRLPNGKYAREDIIHNLIMPMQMTSTDVLMDSCNLWLVDERLAFHNYLASDKTLASMPITESNSTKEPDLCALNIYDNPILVSEGSKLPLASIIVVEIKRPMRNDTAPGEVDDPVEQAIGYLNRIRTGKAMTAQGRPIPESENIPGFCYVIADLTPKLKERCLIHHDLKWTYDKMGFFGYKQNCKAYIAVISFEQLVNAAKERNRAFFDKLGLPSK